MYMGFDHDYGHDHGHAIHEVSRYGTVQKIHVHAPRTKLSLFDFYQQN